MAELPTPHSHVTPVYRERGIAAVLAAKLALRLGHKAGTKSYPDGKQILYIQLPEGQISWAFDPGDFDLLEGLSPFDGEWDGTYKSRTAELLEAL